MRTWKAGDTGWRGYARHYGDKSRWYPEIRPATVRTVQKDGRLELHMEGVLPGTEGKRNPGGWIAWNVEPELLHTTPEAALRMAKRVAVDAAAEVLTKKEDAKS